MNSLTNQKWVLSFLLLLFITGLSAQNVANNTVEKLHDEYKKNGVEAAIKTYKSSEVNKEYEGTQEPLNVLGYRLLNEDNDLEAAEAVFMAQIEEYPNHPNPYDSYADAMIKKGNEEEAKKHLKKSVNLLKDGEETDFNKNLMINSKSKLARLEGKHKALNFLAGTWEIENYEVKDGEKTLRFTDDVSFEPSKFNSVMITRFFNEEDQFEGTQLITYDAINDEFDIVRVNNNRLIGFQTATFKIKESSENKVVVIETNELDDETIKTKHVFNKKDGNIEWEIHEMKDDEEIMVAINNMKKKN